MWGSSFMFGGMKAYSLDLRQKDRIAARLSAEAAAARASAPARSAKAKGGRI